MKYVLLLLMLPACFPLYPFPEGASEPGPTGPTGTPDSTFNTISLAQNTLTLHVHDRVALPLMTSGSQVQVSELPAGVSVIATTTALTFTTDASVLAGSTQVSVTASSDLALPGAVTLTLTIVATPRFSVSPAQQTIVRGSSALLTVNVVRDAAFSGVATIEVLDLGSALMTTTIAPLQAQESERVITITSNPQAAPSLSTVRVRVTHDGGALPDASATITLTAAPGTQDFVFGVRTDPIGLTETYPVQALPLANGSVLLLVDTYAVAGGDPTARAMAQLLLYENEAAPRLLTEIVPPDGTSIHPKMMSIDAMGRIVVVSTLEDQPNVDGVFISRSLPDGTPDDDFGLMGEYSVSVLPDGNHQLCNLAGVFFRSTDIYVVGKSVNFAESCADAAQTQSFVFKVSGSGVAENALTTIHSEGNAYDQQINASAEDASGAVILVGGSSHSGTSIHALVHGFSSLTPPTVAANGFANLTFTTSVTDGFDVFNSAVATEGGFYAAGVALRDEWGASQHPLIARFTTNGLLDTSFADVGFTHLALDATTLHAEAQVVMNDSANRALIAGTHTDDQNQKRGRLCRLTLAGALDTAFGNAGCSIVAHGSGDATLDAATLDTQGRAWLFSFLAGSTSIVAARYFAN